MIASDEQNELLRDDVTVTILEHTQFIHRITWELKNRLTVILTVKAIPGATEQSLYALGREHKFDTQEELYGLLATLEAAPSWTSQNV